MGFVLLATFLGLVEALIGLALGLGPLAALAVWTFGGVASATVLLALSRLLPPAPGLSIDALLPRGTA